MVIVVGALCWAPAGYSPEWGLFTMLCLIDLLSARARVEPRASRRAPLALWALVALALLSAATELLSAACHATGAAVESRGIAPVSRRGAHPDDRTMIVDAAIRPVESRLPHVAADHGVHLAAAGSAQEDDSADVLPAPMATGKSVELCLNSRYSAHDLGGAVSIEQIGHVLWAAGRAPVVGAYRRLWVSTPTGTYLYDPVEHALSHRTARTARFTLTFDTELAFDAGITYPPAILASVSLWQDGGVSMASCPKGLELRFGVQSVEGLTSVLVAHSSAVQGEPEWLPDPSTEGSNHLEDVLRNLRYGTDFAQTALTLQQISQILWAGYGCTPHTTYNGRAGLTVPSAYANYYLTGMIYLANEEGVYRYLNRNPDGDLTTRDHRLGRITSDDVREPLCGAVGGLPRAPCYIMLCLRDADVEQRYAQLETGFVASNMLIQASAIGLGCHFRVRLSAEERGRIQALMGMPAAHVPQAVVSIGPLDEPLTSPVLIHLAFPAGHSIAEGQATSVVVRFCERKEDSFWHEPTYEFIFSKPAVLMADTRTLEIPGVRHGVYDVFVHCDCGMAGVQEQVTISADAAELHVPMSGLGDIYRDDIVNFEDFATLSASWHAGGLGPEYRADCDLDGDGYIGLMDFCLLVDRWLTTALPGN